MNRALIFAVQFPDAKRKNSINWLCDALLRRGWAVDFVTIGQSPIMELSPRSQFNPRNYWRYLEQRPVNEWVRLAPQLWSFIWKAPFHPVNLRCRLLNKIVTPLHRMYPRLLPEQVRLRAKSANLILFDSPYSTMFIGMMRTLAPDAALVYNATDRLRTFRLHPLISECESRDAPLLDLVRVSAKVMAGDFPAGVSVAHIPQGLDAASFLQPSENPFSSPRNAISIGDGLFDARVIDVLATSFPDWNFHLFGARSVPTVPRTNIMVHGEEKFANLVPYLKYADAGLAPYRQADSAEYLPGSSLRMILYTFCHLPILAPFYAVGERAHVCGYQPGDAASLREAFAKVIRYDRGSIDASEELSWDDVLEQILERAFAVREERCALAVRAEGFQGEDSATDVMCPVTAASSLHRGQ